METRSNILKAATEIAHADDELHENEARVLARLSRVLQFPELAVGETAGT